VSPLRKRAEAGARPNRERAFLKRSEPSSVPRGERGRNPRSTSEAAARPRYSAAFAFAKQMARARPARGREGEKALRVRLQARRRGTPILPSPLEITAQPSLRHFPARAVPGRCKQPRYSPGTLVTGSIRVSSQGRLVTGRAPSRRGCRGADHTASVGAALVVLRYVSVHISSHAAVPLDLVIRERD
jgi:hypothetical protein